LFNRETGISMVGWMVFLVGASIYCLVYNQLVLVTPTSFMNSFLWSLREYSAWLVITPLLFFSLRRTYRPMNPVPIRLYGLLGSTALLVALLVHLVIDIHPQYPSTLANAVDIFPSQLAVTCLLITLWHLCFRPASQPQHTTNSPANSNDTVRVLKGNGEAVVSWASVDFISAAGNYMELSCADEKYLLRITLKELEQKLPAQQFIRVHRSHIVNITAIRRIGSQNGNGFVELRNHHIVPLSKGYKPALDAIPFTPHTSHH
jgi:hypothetical protein